MILVPLGVLWVGYSFVWYGFTTLKGPGMGLADLVFPSRVDKATAQLKQLASLPVGPGYIQPPGSTTSPPLQVGPGTIFPPGSPGNPNIPAAFNPSGGRNNLA